MPSRKRCVTCKHWTPVRAGSWQGRCPKHPERKTMWSQSAEAGKCRDYFDPYAIYKLGGKR